MTARLSPPGAEKFERVSCYCCGRTDFVPFVEAEDDLTGKPGRFRFVECRGCGLVYQNPRLRLEHIGAYYDDEYIAHRKKSDWGIWTPVHNWSMKRLDRAKLRLVRRFAGAGQGARILDVGCGAGTFLAAARSELGAAVCGVDFKDLSHLPWLRDVEFRHGLFYEQRFSGGFDVITMWHFFEHDYDPARTLTHARDALAADGRLVIEVPRLDSLSFRLFHERWPGLQAPQHTVLYSKNALLTMIKKAGLEVMHYLPYGAFPAYFYLFAGAAFKRLKGRGLNLSRAVGPYYVGELLLSPLLLFERQLNLAMQTVVCRRGTAR